MSLHLSPEQAERGVFVFYTTEATTRDGNLISASEILRNPIPQYYYLNFAADFFFLAPMAPPAIAPAAGPLSTPTPPLFNTSNAETDDAAEDDCFTFSNCFPPSRVGNFFEAVFF